MKKDLTLGPFSVYSCKIRIKIITEMLQVYLMSKDFEKLLNNM